ncbi:hypothetical protein [uncultured Psychroserpens sp.]|uniref:hypothetical protein n=1 Tax=uncultured Psychroserpens sp. TaxID=255436 RepID=UPI0026329094|nr:hypothetical protein [uncultured Psychroserpens sp.]
MKNKKKTYILLVLVVSVWGIIGYKIVTGINPKLPEQKQQNYSPIKKFKVDTKIDTFSIQPVDKDPFLGIVTRKRSQSKITKIKSQTTPWLLIEYLGMIKHSNREQNVYVISINSKQYLFKKGQIKNDVKLLYGNNDAVMLRFNKQQKMFKRKNQS